MVSFGKLLLHDISAYNRFGQDPNLMPLLAIFSSPLFSGGKCESSSVSQILQPKEILVPEQFPSTVSASYYLWQPQLCSKPLFCSFNLYYSVSFPALKTFTKMRPQSLNFLLELIYPTGDRAILVLASLVFNIIVKSYTNFLENSTICTEPSASLCAHGFGDSI